MTQLIIMLICEALSGYFSATETAFSCMNKTRIKSKAEKGNKRALLALQLGEDYDRLLSTILIGNNIVNIALASLGTMLFVSIYGDIGATISTVVCTVVVLIFGEVSPKSIAKDCPEKFAMFSAPFIQLLVWVLLPFNFLFTQWKKLLSKLFKHEEESKMSQEELLMLVEEVEQDGSIDSDEGSLLKNVIEFTDLKVEEILTHRVDIEGFSVDTPKDEIGRLFVETKFSRLLVYEGDIDHVVGVLNHKDFYTEDGVTDREISELISEPLFVPKVTRSGDLLKQLQSSQAHLAVVVGEYGETEGIVTMEDILEELVGEIWDVHDEVVELFHAIDETTWRVGCDVALSEFGEHFGLEIESESSTLNGWITEQIEKIAEEGDVFTFQNLDIRVVEVESHRATFVEVTVLPEETEAEEDAPEAEE